MGIRLLRKEKRKRKMKMGVFVEIEQAARLHYLNDILGIPVSRLVRMGIRKVLQAYTSSLAGYKDEIHTKLFKKERGL